METQYTVFQPDGSTLTTEVKGWPDEPGYDTLSKLLRPLLGGDLEHVSVLYDGEGRDMFVDELGAIKGLPPNEAASKIYQAATLRRRPRCDPKTLPLIYGPAVLFLRRVWF